MTEPAKWIQLGSVATTPRLRVLCFPHAGGGASTFRSWRGQLPAGVEVCAIQLPGHETRMAEQPHQDVTALVGALATEVRGLLDTPYVTFGHSLGALVSFELVRRLRRLGAPQPQRMIVSGRAAPQVPRRHPMIHRLPGRELLSELSTYGGTEAELLNHPQLMDLLLPTIRADLTINETYTYVADAPLSCPITAIYGVDDALVERAEIEAWQAQTDHALTVRAMPGGHFYLHTEQRSVLAEITSSIS